MKIKLQNAKQTPARKNIIKELELLQRSIPVEISKDTEVFDYRLKLASINQNIWNIEDQIRAKEAAQDFDKEFIELARSTYLLNDERAYLKRHINDLLRSSIVEEKIY